MKINNFFKKNRIMNTKTNKQEEEQHEEEAMEQQNSSVEEQEMNDETTEVLSESEQEIEKLKAQLAELNDKFLRQAAEFDNFRRRTAKEKSDLIKFGTQDLMTALLEVLDDSDRAQAQWASGDDLNLHKDGILLVFNKLNKVLQSKGLKEMESKNQEFNADLFEAITEVPAPTEELKGKVLDEIQKGYYLNDKIIRHAKVVVGK